MITNFPTVDTEAEYEINHLGDMLMLSTTMKFLENAKASGSVAGAMLLSGLTNFWGWLGGNIGLVTGLLGLLIGLVTLYVQCLTAKIRIIELNKIKNAEIND